jgi:hypothetical protein
MLPEKCLHHVCFQVVDVAQAIPDLEPVADSGKTAKMLGMGFISDMPFFANMMSDN